MDSNLRGRRCIFDNGPNHLFIYGIKTQWVDLQHIEGFQCDLIVNEAVGFHFGKITNPP